PGRSPGCSRSRHSARRCWCSARQEESSRPPCGCARARSRRSPPRAAARGPEGPPPGRRPEPPRGLVQQHHARPRHERAPERGHLLLAARGVARLRGAALLEARKITVDLLQLLLYPGAAHLPCCTPGVGAREKIFLHGEV